MAKQPRAEPSQRSPHVRLYVGLNRVWFFGFVILVEALAWIGADLVSVLILAAFFALVTITLLHPRRSWWGPDVRAFIGNRRVARILAGQDLIVLAALLMAPVLVGIILSLTRG